MNRKTLSLTFLLLLIILTNSSKLSFGSDELIEDGSFESGSLASWKSHNAKILGPLPTAEVHNAHSGRCSLTFTEMGTVSQTISVTPLSLIEITFWYKTHQESNLACILLKTDGSVIKQFSVTESESWNQFSENMIVEENIQEIVVEFRGESSVEIVPYYDVHGYLLYEYVYQQPYIDDVSVKAKAAFYSVTFKISGAPSDVSTIITIDGGESIVIDGEGYQEKNFPIKSNHSAKVNKEIDLGTNVKYICEIYEKSFSSGGTIEFTYIPQYRLNVVSEHGNVKGKGWYKSDEIASISVEPSSFQSSNLFGIFGPKYVFKGWTGLESPVNSSTAQIVMDSPKTVTALWESEYSYTYTIFGGILMGATAIGIASIFILIKHSGRKKPQKKVEGITELAQDKMLEEETIPEPIVSVSVTSESIKEKSIEPRYKKADRTILESDILETKQKLRTLDETYKSGSISKNVYDTLRKEYEKKIKEKTN